MGVYYIVVNEDKREWLDPAKVGGGAVKSGFCLNLGALVVHLMTYDWHGERVEVVDDHTDRQHDIETSPDYEDVTLAKVADFNESYSEHRLELHVPREPGT